MLYRVTAAFAAPNPSPIDGNTADVIALNQNLACSSGSCNTTVSTSFPYFVYHPQRTDSHETNLDYRYERDEFRPCNALQRSVGDTGFVVTVYFVRCRGIGLIHWNALITDIVWLLWADIKEATRASSHGTFHTGIEVIRIDIVIT